MSSGEIVWVDGALADAATARVSVFDHGLTVGDGIFETMKIVRGEAFAMRRHLDRLRRSADGLGLAIPLSDDELRRAVAATVEANGLTDGRARLTVTGGIAPLGSDRGTSVPTVIVAASPLAPWSDAARVVVVPWRRNEHSAVAGLKTTSYADNVVALRFAREQDADEAIFANTAGNLCEGTGTNIFVGDGASLTTPPLKSGCLAGITRGLVLELVDVTESDLPIAALSDVGEAFLTSSTREVQPIAAIDGRELPLCPGPLTSGAQTAFADLRQRDLDP